MHMSLFSHLELEGASVELAARQEVLLQTASSNQQSSSCGALECFVALLAVREMSETVQLITRARMENTLSNVFVFE